MPNRPYLFPARGSTLVEVTIAIGIFACAFLAIWGVLNVGTLTWRQARSATVMSQIQQRIFSAAVQGLNNPTNMASLTNIPFYFDDEGLSLTNATTNNWVYQVHVTSSTNVPGASSMGLTNANLALLSVQTRSRWGDSKTNYQFIAPPPGQ